MKAIMNFDYIKVDERMGRDGCKQGHQLGHYLACLNIYYTILARQCKTLISSIKVLALL